MNKSESIKNLAKALSVFQSKVEAIKKTETNPFFKSKYADLSNIIESTRLPLAEAGLSYSQFPTGDNGLTTILMHAESGEYLESTYNMQPAKNDPQGQGSAITYQRRYALSAVLGLSTENDDDANAASAKTYETQNVSYQDHREQEDRLPTIRR